MSSDGGYIPKEAMIVYDDPIAECKKRWPDFRFELRDASNPFKPEKRLQVVARWTRSGHECALLYPLQVRPHLPRDGEDEPLREERKYAEMRIARGALFIDDVRRARS